MASHVVFEVLIIAGVLAASAILIYVVLKIAIEVTSRDNQEVRIRRMARTLVRAVEKRAEWDTTIRSSSDKFARITLVLQDEFDIEQEWLHIIIGEAQFDMEADNASRESSNEDTIGAYDRHRFERVERQTIDDRGYDDRDTGSSWDGDSGDAVGHGARAALDDFGEDQPLPSAE